MTNTISYSMSKIQKKIIGETRQENNELLDHAVIGISPFNSYFTEDNITKLIGWALQNFKEIVLFIPNGWCIYTLMAQGYTEEKARKKTKKRDAHLKNKVIRAFKNNGIDEEEALRYFLGTEILLKNKIYCEIFDKCVNQFNNDPLFKEICLSTSRDILSKTDEVINEDMVHIAVNYVLRELPLFLDLPKILGVSSSCMVYHKIQDITEYIYKPENFISPNQGYIIAN